MTCYRELSHALPAGRGVYGLEADGQRSVEAMAERYLDAIRTVVGDGPFLVGGWSMGALVAWAMASHPRRVGPVVTLAPGESYETQVRVAVHDHLENVAALEAIAGSMTSDRPPLIHREPQPGFSPV